MYLHKEYRNEAEHWCEKLRETWERMIEEIVFNEAIMRYSPAIQTNRLKKSCF